jgi:hypothetical protein
MDDEPHETKEKKTQKNETKKRAETTVAESETSMEQKRMIGVCGNLIGWFALDDRKRFNRAIINSESHRRSKTRNSKTVECRERGGQTKKRSHMNAQEYHHLSSRRLGRSRFFRPPL